MELVSINVSHSEEIAIWALIKKISFEIGKLYFLAFYIRFDTLSCGQGIKIPISELLLYVQAIGKKAMFCLRGWQVHSVIVHFPPLT